MLFQCNNYEFSVPVVSHSKAHCEGKGMALAREPRLAVNVDKLTELVIITLKEHQA